MLYDKRMYVMIPRPRGAQRQSSAGLTATYDESAPWLQLRIPHQPGGRIVPVYTRSISEYCSIPNARHGSCENREVERNLARISKIATGER